MFNLGPHEYESKEALKARFKTFLETAPEGAITNPIAIDKLQYLLMLHPRAAEKIGLGVARFLVERNHHGSGRGFKIVRVDGTEERFSYKACLEGKVPTHRSRVIEALRFAVRPQLLAYRKSLVLPIICAITNDQVADHEDIHIDHKVPFWMLVNRFCWLQAIDLGELETVGTGEHLKLADDEVARRFEEFHREYAQLQATRKRANLKKGGRLSGQS
ncbi:MULTISPECIES: DCL family protein [Burkholderia]|uniref:DCL family protein n=1 Tax=Burkholderia TaxID=32008 RepID=UPI000752DDD2|nr:MULTISPECIES: DCL family protein [Burkholderia]KVC94919.1 hypothetical protein WI77_10545 [Burkholderia ubonensis]VBI28673.1 Protein of uncharacterised function (DUF3223) [Burkholderia pseudomallei]